jgi:hypothetical protein
MEGAEARPAAPAPLPIGRLADLLREATASQTINALNVARELRAAYGLPQTREEWDLASALVDWVELRSAWPTAVFDAFYGGYRELSLPVALGVVAQERQALQDFLAAFPDDPEARNAHLAQNEEMGMDLLVRSRQTMDQLAQALKAPYRGVTQPT